MNQLLNGLNEGQLAAVISQSTRILCLAGAGTGKTRVLTHRIAYLNDEYRVGTSNMLALTFTRLAGKEMKERLMKLVGETEGQKLFCNTFHAFCVKVFKEYGHRIGLDANFMIYDQSDRDSIIKKIIAEYCYDTTLNKVLSGMSESNEHTEEYKVLKELDFRLKQNNAVDLDGLLTKTRQLLEENSDVCDKYRNEYKYVYIDEFQDTSDVQMKIIELINPDNLFVVGDDFQSIYGWRGAEVRNILEFPHRYPGCEVVKLTRNYRSTIPIIDASNKLIKCNINQSEKELVTEVAGQAVEMFLLDNENSEADQIISVIEDLKGEIESFSDIAVLARTNKQLDYMSKKLQEVGLPVLLLSNRYDPLKDNVVQMCIGYLELVINQKESWKTKRLVNFPEPRLTPLQIEEIELYCIEEDATYLEALEHFKSKYRALESFLGVLDKLRTEQIYSMDAQTAFRAIVHLLGIIPMYQEQGLDNRIQTLAIARDRIGKWVELQRKLGEIFYPDAFLRWMVTKDIQEKLLDDSDAIRLMTVHGSKGLEFENVFVIGMNEGVFPSLRGDIEEERRLMYVASTRAKKRLILTRPKAIRTYSGDEELREPSRFLSEMGV
ncbi:ATP-dependent helicase [Schinkia azotoformans]|uniref:DNA 3'-5' helicase n=1 Tax=Schinkia azotoformans LMG 9581 TaxID=1131731 RepID=K6DHQ8_SCHAZ|nr:ATP-dependent helicase [Schinkia azotoformans]EKN67849.1 ATP-dependent DNA helicase [Schinkia azotoformans LMG 9581]MEC1637385.1 ATP-dependent helicase [Schinkia azotoformans]MEC1943789.1 ATP-dependent helicase [Schinkia azotoformans]